MKETKPKRKAKKDRDDEAEEDCEVKEPRKTKTTKTDEAVEVNPKPKRKAKKVEDTEAMEDDKEVEPKPKRKAKKSQDPEAPEDEIEAEPKRKANKTQPGEEAEQVKKTRKKITNISQVNGPYDGEEEEECPGEKASSSKAKNADQGRENPKKTQPKKPTKDEKDTKNKEKDSKPAAKTKSAKPADTSEEPPEGDGQVTRARTPKVHADLVITTLGVDVNKKEQEKGKEAENENEKEKQVKEPATIKCDEPAKSPPKESHVPPMECGGSNLESQWFLVLRKHLPFMNNSKFKRFLLDEPLSKYIQHYEVTK